MIEMFCSKPQIKRCILRKATVEIGFILYNLPINRL